MFKILFVDDEPNILNALSRMLRHKRTMWEMYFVQGVEEALEILRTKEIDVVISDISMPVRDGFDLLTTIRSTTELCDIPFLMLTGLDETDLKRKALDLGATDLLNKPANREDLIARINNMLRIKAYQDEIRAQNVRLDLKVKERTAELESTRLELIWRLGRAAEYRDTDTGNHVVRVGYYCKVLAEELGMPHGFIESIFLTSPLHDIGKIGIPDRILLKKGKLSAPEWKIMKQHCKIGGDILSQDTVNWAPSATWQVLFSKPASKKSDNPFLKMAKTITLTHHEHWNGNGYPWGLSGNEIPIESRIVAIADVYDALFSKRPYKVRYETSKVMEIMRQNNGRQFDADVFASFEKILDLFCDIRTQFVDTPIDLKTL
ncbi:MAG: response regulator [Desulfobacterium sp.]|nr:response regulator [Desulfobacterium sp.]